MEEKIWKVGIADIGSSFFIVFFGRRKRTRKPISCGSIPRKKNADEKEKQAMKREFLKELGIVKKQLSGIKVLGNGTLEKKLTIKAHRFTESALKKIEESGSKAEVI